MTSNTRRSRVPDIPGIDPSHYQFLDSLDKRQQRVAEIADPDDAATNADLAAAIRAILAAHRTR